MNLSWPKLEIAAAARYVCLSIAFCNKLLRCCLAAGACWGVRFWWRVDRWWDGGISVGYCWSLHLFLRGPQGCQGLAFLWIFSMIAIYTLQGAHYLKCCSFNFQFQSFRASSCQDLSKWIQLSCRDLQVVCLPQIVTSSNAWWDFFHIQVSLPQRFEMYTSSMEEPFKVALQTVLNIAEQRRQKNDANEAKRQRSSWEESPRNAEGLLQGCLTDTWAHKGIIYRSSLLSLCQNSFEVWQWSCQESAIAHLLPAAL